MEMLCSSIKNLEIALDNPVDKKDVSNYEDMKVIFQKSIVAVKEIPKGKALTEDMIGYKKPGTGIPTKYYKEVLGHKVKRDLSFDDIIGFDDLEGFENK